MSSNATTSSWTGLVAVEDTALAVTDTGGSGPAVVYLNGSYADQSHWRRVVADLGGGFRHITFDERARGKSRPSGDYSFAACLRDLDAVLTARGVERPVLVGWSYGALIAAHWAARHPERTGAVVPVDGAMPTDPIDEATRARVRTLFRRLSPIFPIGRRLGLAARMSAAQHAEINLELIDLCEPAALGPVIDGIEAPTRYVLGTGGSLGADEKTIEKLRADLLPMIAGKPNIRVHAKVAGSHTKILRKNSPAVADAVRALAGELRPDG
ncbi:alpha/beta hydrolase [Kitasatospora sp. NPDC006697]|uniref:alpha/beta hydrolase n=1 Tax=Kitasatospora sp. NPDC006697 TaxID=3364020 RepID=UPI0036B9D0A6